MGRIRTVHIPYLGAVPIAPNEASPIWAERDGTDSGIGLDALDLSGSTNIPQPDLSIPIAGSERVAIRTETNGPDVSGVSGERSQFLPGIGVPDFDSPIEASVANLEPSGVNAKEVTRLL